MPACVEGRQVYDGITFDEGLRLDVLVEDKVICELKSVEEMKPLFTAQLLTQLKLTGKRLGFLINFNVPVIKSGIKRLDIQGASNNCTYSFSLPVCLQHRQATLNADDPRFGHLISVPNF